MSKADEALPSSPAVGMTLLLLVGAAGFMVVFFALFQLLGIGMPAFGLLFLVYWAAILNQDLSAYFPSLLGGLTGILVGWLLVAVFAPIGKEGVVLSLLTVGVVLFCFMRGQVKLVVNNATMLFLTVATIGGMNVAKNAPMMAASLLVGAAYMGGTTLTVKFVLRKWGGQPAGAVNA